MSRLPSIRRAHALALPFLLIDSVMTFPRRFDHCAVGSDGVFLIAAVQHLQAKGQRSPRGALPFDLKPSLNQQVRMEAEPGIEPRYTALQAAA